MGSPTVLQPPYVHEPASSTLYTELLQLAAAGSVQPGAFGHEPSFMVAIGEYLASFELMQPRKTQAGGPGVLKLGW